MSIIKMVKGEQEIPVSTHPDSIARMEAEGWKKKAAKKPAAKKAPAKKAVKDGNSK